MSLPPHRRFLAQIGKQDVFACADPPRNSLTDRSGADNYDNLCHDVILVFESEVLLSLTPMLLRT